MDGIFSLLVSRASKLHRAACYTHLFGTAMHYIYYLAVKTAILCRRRIKTIKSVYLSV